MTRWYRAYSGTVRDDKIAECAVIAGCGKVAVIATWHAILESAADAGDGGRFETTPRRVAALFGEPAPTIEGIFAAMTELGMIADGIVLAWSKRQFESDSSTERSRKHREAKRNGDATLQKRSATPPEAEAEAETERTSGSSEAAAPRGREAAAAAADPSDAYEHSGLREACLDAAGLAADPRAVLWPDHPIVACQAAGASLEADILPTIRAVMGRTPTPRPSSWRFFSQAIMDAKAGRELPAPIGRATGPPRTSAAAENREVRAKLSEIVRNLDSVDEHRPREHPPDRPAYPLLAVG